MTIATRGQGITGDTIESQGSSPGPSENNPDEIQDENYEPDFPKDKLASLDEKISNLRWVVPVLADQELECLLKVSIELSKKNLDIRSEPCQRFFREGLTTSFTKILTDDAVSSWKPNIHACIFQNCLKLIELCVAKLPHDWFPLLDLLAMVLNPNNKFHTYNSSRQSETAGPNSNLTEEELFARPSSDLRNPRGWLVDLINRQILLDRFQSGQNLSVSIVFALLRPFGLCYEFLTTHTIKKYILPILLTDDELKREAKSEQKSDIVSAIIKASKNLASRVPDQEELIRTLEGFRLTMILRQLQISSFNGKMNALNEINKVISSVTYYPNRHHGLEEEEYLTPERMAKWINENKVLEIVLRDSLHQPQYVEKLEKILRFVIKERALSLSDLDAVWAAQVGKHEAIVKNVHDLLAKLAWDFSAEQLDHLFECFQNSWTSASKRQRERLLELIRRLAEDDKDGVMAHKVLTLFWNLAHAEDVPTEIMDQALTAHVKILDYSCSQERDAQKTIWLDKCVEELKSGDGKWVLPALKQIKDICTLYEQNTNGGPTQRSHHIYYRQDVIERLQNQHSLVILVTNSLTGYMERLRQLYKEQPHLTADTFLLKDGQLWLCAEQAKQIWQSLAENAVFQSDRESCFKWFSKLMGEEPDLDPGINKDFFENNILQIDPILLTESGIKFFKAVNAKEGKIKFKRRTLLTEDPDLIGLDYLWKVVTLCPNDIAARAIELLKEVSTNLGPRLQAARLDFHENFVTECYDRLRAHFDTLTVLQKSTTSVTSAPDDSLTTLDGPPAQMQHRIQAEAVKMCRVLKLMPCDLMTMDKLRVLFTTPGEQNITMDTMFFSANPAELFISCVNISGAVQFGGIVRYVDAALDTLSEKTYDFQYSFMTSGQAHVFLEMLTKNNFMSSADNVTKRSAYLVVLKICKLILTSVAHVLVRLSEDHTPQPTENDSGTDGGHENTTTPGMYLRQALRNVPGHSDHLSHGLAQLMVSESCPTSNNRPGGGSGSGNNAHALFSQALNWELPDLATALALVRLVWAASSDNLAALNASPDTLHSLAASTEPKNKLKEGGNAAGPRELEALELLSTAVVLNSSSLEHLYQDNWWPYFVTDLVLINPCPAIRVAAAEQLIVICTCGAASRLALQLIGNNHSVALYEIVRLLPNYETSRIFYQFCGMVISFCLSKRLHE
nr:unnamed protein product [Callosobruchus analis]